MSWQQRQSFLGPDSDATLAGTRVGIAGLGGGGSQISQELAHVGVGRFVLADFDHYEDKNHNRTVGGTWNDIEQQNPKVLIAKRLILGVNSSAQVFAVQDRWQAALPQFRDCDAVFGCVDSYSQRDQLENLCRRYYIPYIDIGMDVRGVEEGYAVHGQVILSMPGSLCLRCFNFLRPELLELEAQEYGKAGGRPQVIWPNGVLASTAVGILMELKTPWHSGSIEQSVVYDYDGNKHTMALSPRVRALAGATCPHFRSEDLGDPFWKPAQQAPPSVTIHQRRLPSALRRLVARLRRK